MTFEKTNSHLNLDPMFFLATCPPTKGYNCFNPSTTKIYISRHVRFLEQVFPFTANFEPSSSKPSTPHTLPLPFSPATPSPPFLYTPPLPLNSPFPTLEPPHSPKPSPSLPHQPMHPMVTYTHDHTRQPRSFLDHITYTTSTRFTHDLDPASFTQVNKHPH